MTRFFVRVWEYLFFLKAAFELKSCCSKKAEFRYTKQFSTYFSKKKKTVIAVCNSNAKQYFRPNYIILLNRSSKFILIITIEKVKARISQVIKIITIAR